MAETSLPPDTPSQQGRRILVAVVTGDAGERIQRWREQYDPAEARRLPPHTTLCYYAPAVESSTLAQQVRHAFAAPVTVRLGRVSMFDNRQQTFYLPVEQSAPLDAARRLLYDGAYLPLPGYGEWTWHITCIRESLGRDPAPLLAAAGELEELGTWQVNRIAYMELRGDRYETLAAWDV